MTTRYSATFSILMILMFFPSYSVLGQTNMSKQQKDDFLTDLVASFKEEFLWKKKGEEVAKSLELLIKRGSYSNITEADIFVEILSRDLYKLTNDLHLKIDLTNTDPVKAPTSFTLSNRPTILKEYMNDGIYYLKVDIFQRLQYRTTSSLEPRSLKVFSYSTILA